MEKAMTSKPTARERFLEIKQDGFSPLADPEGQNQYDIGFLISLVEAAMNRFAESLPGDCISWETGEKVNKLDAVWKEINQRLAEGEKGGPESLA